jgi:hypothetical protein
VHVPYAMHMGCAPPAGSSRLASQWNAASGGTCVRHHGNRCDLIEVAAPGRLPLAACSNAPGVSCTSADPRATGRGPVGDHGSTVESHVARLFKFAPPMCNVCSRTEHGHALRLVQLAARQLTAVAQPLSTRFGYIARSFGTGRPRTCSTSSSLKTLMEKRRNRAGEARGG